MKGRCRSTLRLILAVGWIALCCSTLLTAQNNAANADNNQAVADQLRQMQQQLNEQQQQINRLQGELREARQPVKLVNSGSQPGVVPIGYSEPSGEPSAAVAVATPPPGPPPGPTVVPAIAPLRVLPVDAPKTGGLIPAFKIGPVSMTPYGFIKSTAVKDTSNPNGDDFPFVGLFLTQNCPNCGLTTGPTEDPAFFVKARSTRFGANIEWPDVSKRLTLTGRIEGDFEGNFNESDNRDVSSIRSNNPNLRLAFVRLDYHASEDTDIYFEGGQDWTLFGSSALMPILETTFLGAYYGSVYERSPQLLGGIVHTLTPWRNLKLSGTFGIMMPTSSQIEKLSAYSPLAGFEGQIGQAEREGADSGRPEVEGRVALQFQLDQAKGVAPAQILVSGFQGRRRSIVPGPIGYGEDDPAFAYTNGFTVSSEMYGGQIAAQLPTRWVTLVGSIYRGGDLRFFFGGQVNSFADDTGGLTDVEGYYSVDGGPLIAAGFPALATNAAGQVVIVPQKPIRSFGGFVSAGFPLSRIFNANPEGHNAGWQLFFTFGKDQVVHRDLKNPNFAISTEFSSPLPLLMGKVAAATLYYKLNQWCTFGFEQSIYATRLEPKDGGLYSGISYSIAGVASNEWQDHRTEFGPIFTF